VTTTLDYTEDWAATSPGLPFRADSRIGRLLCRHDSTEAEFRADPENWFSERRVQYTTEDMGAFWRMIEMQKCRLQVLWLAATGRARSMMDAYRAMGVVYGQ
jgi:hypothetical protein